MSECENCGDTRAPNVVYPAEKVGPVNVCDACYHFYVDEEKNQ